MNRILDKYLFNTDLEKKLSSRGKEAHQQEPTLPLPLS